MAASTSMVTGSSPWNVEPGTWFRQQAGTSSSFSGTSASLLFLALARSTSELEALPTGRGGAAVGGAGGGVLSEAGAITPHGCLTKTQAQQHRQSPVART
eukprot:CAMPEP_0168489714 /NCGR_PEP_ID=MMETSP0228-20121227/68807_1 /TAXON_ID=133427 /ORGANISM="Protoceratium reticulatum, Strain CCCM 535 (=CCMP 1889)" /LENGTH=99 /DNA_ID=CAMNT_0008506397 /DNA_START=7 /DNA_END=302 /DNA_ORIENTATION=+